MNAEETVQRLDSQEFPMFLLNIIIARIPRTTTNSHTTNTVILEGITTTTTTTTTTTNNNNNNNNNSIQFNLYTC
jgi:hypothetical protein